MKNRILGIVLVLLSLVTLAGLGVAQQQGAIRVGEVDGSPLGNLTRHIKFPNGSLTKSGDTITVGAGGTWLVTGAEGASASLELWADEGDDAADKWTIQSDFSTNSFTIGTGGSDWFTLLSNGDAEFGGAVSMGTVSIVGDLTGGAGSNITGFFQSLVTSTTTTLTTAQCGSTIINDSADVLTLPEASTALGCRYTFVVNNASNLDINPNDGTDTILPFINAVATDPTLISPSAGDAIRCATVGGSITLEAVSANSWAVVGGVAGHGWSDIN